MVNLRLLGLYVIILVDMSALYEMKPYMGVYENVLRGRSLE